MTRSPPRVWFFFLLPLLCASAAGCRSSRTPRPSVETPPTAVQPTIITYVEQDAFDVLFESALLNEDPVILIPTGTSRPDWGPRLNAWIAAWNRGGKADIPRPIIRGQAPFAPVTVNGDTLREFRLLIDDLMKHVDDVARRGSSWWSEERTQRRRITLLRPYSLRFHLDADKHIQLVFFNGKYARYYRQVLEGMAMHNPDEPEDWCRDFKCSHARMPAAEGVPATAGAELGAPVVPAEDSPRLSALRQSPAFQSGRRE